MKEWIRPELEPLEISETRCGGTPSDNIDYAWIDGNGKWQETYLPS